MSVEERYATLVAQGELKHDPVQASALPLLERVAQDVERPAKRSFFKWIEREPVRGLYLWGGVGRGKSMLMDLLVAALKVPVRRVHFHAFMQDIHARLHAERQRGVTDALAPIAVELAQDTRVLAFDEMQITDITDAMIVGRLFKLLFEAGIAIVATSNRIPDDLYKDGLNRQLFLPFIDLIKKHMVVHELRAERDYRQERLAGLDVYFTPADEKARKKIDSIWNDLGGESEALTLAVKGRSILIPKFKNGAARMSFAALCDTPLGPGDYLSISEVCRLLIIEDIPVLSPANANQAKRFVTLIDTLYEARVVVIASAAAAPEALYQHGNGSFEFERTASRLREMQSESWTLGA